MIDPTKPLEETKSAGGAPQGNQNALKFDTPEKRQKLSIDYCIHRLKGLSKDSFIPCSPETFDDYRKKFPVDFDSEAIEEAERGNLTFWETIGVDGTQGKIKGFNSDSWKFNMMNRYRKAWKNREDVTSDDEKLPETKTIIIDTRPPESTG